MNSRSHRLAGSLQRLTVLPAWRVSDQEFSPAVLEVIETPPSPVRVALIITLCALCVIAIATAWVCKMDIYAIARGKIQVEGRSKIVQPLDAGKVIAIQVQNGTRVRSGDTLLILDATEVDAERQEHAEQADEYRTQIARRRAAVSAAQHQPLPLPADVALPRELDPRLRVREERVLAADLQQLKSVLDSLEAKIATNIAKESALRVTIATQRKLLDTLRQRLEIRASLAQKSWETPANVLDAQEALDRELTSLAEHEGQLMEAGAEIVAMRRQKAESLAKFISENSEAGSVAEAKFDEMQQELIKSSAKAARTTLAAPIDGTVQELAVTTIGQVVTTGQQLMTIVPSDAPVEIEALIANQDIGFVRTGQRAIIKIDAFPFTLYGTLSGRVTRVSRDAIDAEDSRVALPGAASATVPIVADASMGVPASQARHLVFSVTIALDTPSIVINDTPMPLVPGMTAGVEITTGKRRLIDFVLGPLRQVSSEALHER
jgi:hemolysin D